MPPRAIELRLDGTNQPRPPLLLVDPADEELARSIAAAMQGRLSIVIASRDASPWRLDGGAGAGRQISDVGWERLGGWAARLSPAETPMLAAEDVADWHAPRLLVQSDDGAGNVTESVYALPVADRAEVDVGRGTENDVVVPDGLLARTHLLIKCREGAYFIRDARPTDAGVAPARVLADGAEVEIHGAAIPVVDREVVLAGRSRFTFQIPSRRIPAACPLESARREQSELAVSNSDGPTVNDAPPVATLERERTTTTQLAAHGDTDRPPQPSTAPVAAPPAAPTPATARPMPTSRPATDAAERRAAAFIGLDEARASRRRVGLTIVGGAALLLAAVGISVAWILVQTR